MESNNKIKELENYLDDMDNLIDTGWFKDESIKYWAYYHNDMSLREFVSKGREYIRQYLMEEKGMKDAI
jgi:antitoxin component YwqK of YwqJK toxin-antitoxin module